MISMFNNKNDGIEKTAYLREIIGFVMGYSVFIFSTLHILFESYSSKVMMLLLGGAGVMIFSLLSLYLILNTSVKKYLQTLQFFGLLLVDIFLILICFFVTWLAFPIHLIILFFIFYKIHGLAFSSPKDSK